MEGQIGWGADARRPPLQAGEDSAGLIKSTGGLPKPRKPGSIHSAAGACKVDHLHRRVLGSTR
jgi:hypothetical protein